MEPMTPTETLPKVALSSGGRMLIGSDWREAQSGKRFKTLNPATGDTLLEVAEGDARRRGAHRSLEFSVASRRAQGRAGAGCGEYGDSQTRRGNAAHGAPPRRARARGGDSARRAERRARIRTHGGWRARRACGRERRRLHGRNDHGAAERAARRELAEEGVAGARRKVPEHRLRGRGSGGRGTGNRLWDFLQQGGGLHGGVPALRGARGPRFNAPEGDRPRAEISPGRSSGSQDPPGGQELRGPDREDLT